jgi:membrane-associated phospholipid phosphatase/MFS family permease
VRTRSFLISFGAAAVGFGAARALATSYIPVLLDRIHDAPGLIGLVMLINAVIGLTVPLIAGVVTDRRRPGRLGRRGGVLAWGAVIAAGGLVAVATGTTSSYLALALAAAVVYTGLNVATTAHRAVVAEAFPYDERPRATSTQELAALLGGLVGTLAGGLLIDPAAPAAFLVIAVLVLVAAVPTLRLAAVREAGATVERSTRPPLRDLWAIAQRPGAREVLIAQVLWVTGYAAVPTFLILYADDVLDVGAGAAGGMIVAFGALTGLGTLVAGRLTGPRLERGLLLGVALLGVGGLAAIPATSLATAALPFALVAFGAGLATALGYPYFTRFVGADQAGRAAGLFFSVRSIGSAVALPVAGGLAQVGGYRWIWVTGGVALLALVPLRRTMAARDRAMATDAPRPAVARVGVVVPYLASARVADVARRVAAQPEVVAVAVVDDGAPPVLAEEVDALAAAPPPALAPILSVHPGRHAGKAGAVLSGIAALRERADLDAIAVVDSDGQHPPERLAAFVAASAAADVVIGRRVGRGGRMPLDRRIANALASALLSLRVGRRLPDTQNGMRLYRLDALDRVPLGPGGYDVETRHLRELVAAREQIAWVPIPTIYRGEPSGFRPVADSARVLLAMAGRARPRRDRGPRAAAVGAHLRLWAPRLGLTVAFGWLVAALLPVLQPLDDRLYLAVNHLGDGPDWLYDAVDPHTRNYALITLLTAIAAAAAYRRVRYALGAAGAVLLAGFGADLIMQVVRMWTDRPRPEEVLGSQAWLSHERDWSQIASFPSGHLVVTSAMVVAAIIAVPRLRWGLVPYVAVIAATRILFGAHFPSDVVVGAVVGVVSGGFYAGLARALGWLPARDVAPQPERARIAGLRSAGGTAAAAAPAAGAARAALPAVVAAEPVAAAPGGGPPVAV